MPAELGTDTHDAIQQAFNWENDHLYSFWLDGQFWRDEDDKPVIPGGTGARRHAASSLIGHMIMLERTHAWSIMDS
jgi:hypothetical protein